MRILYLSCHSVLEFDEVSLFHEMGHEIFSPGAYFDPNNPESITLRPPIANLKYDSKIVEQYHKICGKHPGEDGKNYLTKEFVDNFDIVIVMHVPDWITKNWEVIKHKRVIWRTIGQSISNIEQQVASYRNQGLEIVRYSPRETTVPGYVGADAVIRFYKDPEIYKDWTGRINRVITFAQNMKQRDAACNYSFFEKVTRGFNRHLFGPGNEGKPWTSGKVSFKQLQQEMRDNRCYFFTGTHPASYTLNFIEAFMSGIPIVAIGPQHGNASYFPGHQLYEIPDLIENHSNGFISDSPAELQQYIRLLLDNKSVAQVISANARRSAIEIFGKDKIMKEWKEFLG